MIKALHKYLHKNSLKGKDRLYTFLKRVGLEHRVYTKTNSGVNMYLDPKNYVDSFILQTGSYEDEVADELIKDVDTETVMWDIGANIGFHSLTFMKRHPQNSVYSFEPDYKNFEILKINKELNKLDINLMNFALSKTFSCEQLFSVDGNSGMSTISPWHEFNWNTYPHHILATTGDALIEQNICKSPTIIKVDVEGHELKVLKGLKNTLNNKKVSKIIFESDNNFLESNSEIKEFLNGFGYEYKKLERKDMATDHSLSNFLAFLR